MFENAGTRRSRTSSTYPSARSRNRSITAQTSFLGQRDWTPFRSARRRETDLVETEAAKAVERLPHVDGAAPEGHARAATGNPFLFSIRSSIPRVTSS